MPWKGGTPANISYSTHPKAVDVASAVDEWLTGSLLRTHVGRGARDLGHRVGSISTQHVDRTGDAEVGNQSVTVREHDVRGLDIAVDYALSVRVRQRVRNLENEPARLIDGQSHFTSQPLSQRLALHEGHDVEEPIRGFAAVV